VKVHGLPVIEDAAQAFGGGDVPRRASPRPSASSRPRTSSASATAAWLPQRRGLAARVRMLRFHGSRDKKLFEYVGTTPRWTRAGGVPARLLGQIKVERTTAARRRRYAELGLGELLELPKDEPATLPSFLQPAAPSATSSRAALAAAGIGHACTTSWPLHLQPSMAHLATRKATCPRRAGRPREPLRDAWLERPRATGAVVATLQGAVATPVR